MTISLINLYIFIKKYKVEFAFGLLERIKAKAAGKQGKVCKIKVGEIKTIDIIENLKASLKRKWAS